MGATAGIGSAVIAVATLDAGSTTKPATTYLIVYSTVLSTQSLLAPGVTTTSVRTVKRPFRLTSVPVRFSVQEGAPGIKALFVALVRVASSKREVVRPIVSEYLEQVRDTCSWCALHKHVSRANS